MTEGYPVEREMECRRCRTRAAFKVEGAWRDKAGTKWGAYRDGRGHRVEVSLTAPDYLVLRRYLMRRKS